MKLKPFFLLPWVAVLLTWAGCSRQSDSSSTATDQAPAAEVRGTPISPAPAPAAPEAKAAAVPTPAPAAPAPAPSPASSPAVPAASEAGNDGFQTVGFDLLAGFNYEMPDESVGSTNAPAKPAKEQIPLDIKKLDKQRVALRGFMLPLKVEGGLITELLIMRDQSMCCYGTVPKINEWVSVKMMGKGVKPVMDQAITLYGALKVGEMYENGYLVGIYAMEGEKMAGPLDL
jgi:hypothetical protein